MLQSQSPAPLAYQDPKVEELIKKARALRLEFEAEAGSGLNSAEESSTPPAPPLPVPDVEPIEAEEFVDVNRERTPPQTPLPSPPNSPPRSLRPLNVPLDTTVGPFDCLTTGVSLVEEVTESIEPVPNRRPSSALRSITTSCNGAVADALAALELYLEQVCFVLFLNSLHFIMTHASFCCSTECKVSVYCSVSAPNFPKKFGS